MVTRMVRHHDQDERDHDGSVHWDTIYPVLQRNVEDKIGQRCTYKYWIEHIHIGSSKTRFEYCLNSSSSDSGAHRWNNHSIGVDESCINSVQLERIYLPHWFNQHSITQTGLVAGGKESKEGSQTVFFTPLDPFGSDAHEEEEESSEDCSKPRKVHHQSRWRREQNAENWVRLSRAQDHGLQFWQTKSNAIIVSQSAPNHCIERVVSDNGGRILFQRVLTNTKGWTKSSTETRGIRSSSRSSSRNHDPRTVALAQGNGCEQVIKM